MESEFGVQQIVHSPRRSVGRADIKNKVAKKPPEGGLDLRRLF